MSLISNDEMLAALKDWLGDRVHTCHGWRTRDSNGSFDAHGVLHHWTAMSGISVPVSDQLRVLSQGRPGLNGPLCHLSTTRHGEVWVVAGSHANANHAGLGDSRVHQKVVAGQYHGSPVGTAEDYDGNTFLYGIEHQYTPDDGEFPAEQQEAGVLATAALAQAHGWDAEAASGSTLEHWEWASHRKWDREVEGLNTRTRIQVRTALQQGPGQHQGPEPQQEDDLSDIKVNVPENSALRRRSDVQNVSLDVALSNAWWEAANAGRSVSRRDARRIAKAVARRVKGSNANDIARAVVDEMSKRMEK